MNSLDLQQLAKAMFAGSVIMMVVGLIMCVVFMALWIYPLIHCLKYRNDRDRTVWVLVTLFGGPLGGIIYLCMGRISAPAIPPVVETMNSDLRPVMQKVARTPLDHDAMHDERLRAKAMSDAIWDEVKARRASNR